MFINILNMCICVPRRNDNLSSLKLKKSQSVVHSCGFSQTGNKKLNKFTSTGQTEWCLAKCTSSRPYKAFLK